jgi:hypothetical protein
VVYGAENADAQGDFRVGETMTQVLSWNLVAFCILFSALVVLRWRQLRNEDVLAELREGSGELMFYLVMGFVAVWLLVTLYLVYLGVRSNASWTARWRHCARSWRQNGAHPDGVPSSKWKASRWQRQSVQQKMFDRWRSLPPHSVGGCFCMLFCSS